MKKISSLFLALLFTISLLSSFAVQTSAASAKSIQIGTTYSAKMTDYESDYLYKFSVSSASTVKIALNSNIEGQLKIEIFDVDGNSLDEADAFWSSITGEMNFTRNYSLTKGTYYIEIYAPFSGDNGVFSFKLDATSVGESFPEAEGGSDNYLGKANAIEFGKTYKGQIALNDDSDFYRFTVPAKQKIKINLTTEIEWIYIDLYDADANKIFYDSPITNGTTGKTEYSETITLEKGVYYINISQSIESDEEYFGIYSLNIGLILPAPKLSKVENTTSGVKITWGKVSGADKYRVYRKVKGGEWGKLKDLTSTTLVDKTAKSGKTYYYTVKAYNESGWGAYNKTGLGIKYVATPKLSKIANGKNYIQVNWEKVGGAEGYIVYCKAPSDSQWTKIATIKNGATVKYRDTKVSSGKTYVYTVKAYNGSTKSSYNSTGLKIKFLATPKLSAVTSTKSGVKLSWGKVTGAEGYIVYRKTGSGDWVKLATVKGNSKVSLLDKTAKKGKTYTYTVKAYSGSVKSYYNTTGLKVKDKY